MSINVKAFSDIPAVTELNGTEEILVNDGGVAKRMPADMVKGGGGIPHVVFTKNIDSDTYTCTHGYADILSMLNNGVPFLVFYIEMQIEYGLSGKLDMHSNGLIYIDNSDDYRLILYTVDRNGNNEERVQMLPDGTIGKPPSGSAVPF